MNSIFKSYDRIVIQNYNCNGIKYIGMRGTVIGLHNENNIYQYTILLDMPIEVEGFGSIKGISVAETHLSNAE